MSTQRADKKRQDERLNIRVTSDLLRQLNEAAEAEGVTTASWVKRTLTLALQQRAKP